MNYFLAIVIPILVFLSISSGVTKVMLLQQDVVFFGKYGFSEAMLMFYGVVQVIGGILLALRRTRFIGAAVVAVTFFVSLIVLMLDGNVPVSIVTAIASCLLGFVMMRTRAVTVDS